MIILKKIFDYFVWMMFFGLLLLGGIIYVSDRTYPGDKLYPFKLKFEEFTLATSKILNKQVDISIDLVSKRSKEVAKILTPKNSTETLNRLDTQVQTTAISISQISNPIEKKKAATKYIAQLNEVSTVLTEKQKEFLTPTPPVIQQPSQQQPIKNIIPTSTPKPENSSISEQINSSQETVQQAIEQMNNIESNTEIIPTPQKKEDKSDNNNSDKKNSDNQNKDNKKNEENKDNKDKKD